MREPRPENYDPKARKPKPEAVDMTGVVPLQALQPTADNPPETERDDPKLQPTPDGNKGRVSPVLLSERKTERTEIRTEKRSENRTGVLPIKRRTKRYSFEFYDDQLTKLKQLKRQAEDRGESLTLSDMAREALDFYLRTK